MNIEEAVDKIMEAPDGSVLVARPPLSWGADAIFVMFTDDHRMPQALVDAGYMYLLEKDEVLDLLQFLESKRVGSKTRAEFVVHYAMLDCAPAWIDDIPNK